MVIPSSSTPSGEQAVQSRGFNVAAETEIKRLLERYAEAFRAANLEELLSFYSPNVIAFDMVPSLQFKGRDAYAKAWQDAASMMSAPWIWEVRDQQIYAGDDIAFAHHLVKCGGSSEDGKQNSGWIRHTICLCRMGSEWQIVHDHFSLPVDVATGKALMDAQPEGTAH